MPTSVEGTSVQTESDDYKYRRSCFTQHTDPEPDFGTKLAYLAYVRET